MSGSREIHARENKRRASPGTCEWQLEFSGVSLRRYETYTCFVILGQRKSELLNILGSLCQRSQLKRCEALVQTFDFGSIQSCRHVAGKASFERPAKLHAVSCAKWSGMVRCGSCQVGQDISQYRFEVQCRWSDRFMYPHLV